MKNTLLKLILLIFVSSITIPAFSQAESPYKTDLYKDGAWLIGGFALSGYGLKLVMDKDDLTEEELAKLDKDDIWGIDRWAAGNFDEDASKISDIPFFISFATPLLFTLDKTTRKKSGQIAVMYLESLSTTAALFTITAGLVDKSRPLVYNENVDLDKRLRNNSQRSFYSGHVAASATATFFAAQVFSDFFPDSKAKPYIWAGAALIPATVAFYRTKSGNHFLTDNIIGYALGAASGILVPRLHRNKNSDFKVGASGGLNGQYINLSYRF